MGATVSSITSAYLKFLERQHKSGSYSADHLSNVRRDLTRFAAFVGETKHVAECRQHDLSEWLAAQTQWHSANTKRNSVSSVVGCFRWAEEEELIDRCPYRRPRALRGAIVKPRRPATEEEYLQLFRAGSRALKAALFFLRETGARTCEMREALWTDITVGNRPAIVLWRHKTHRRTGKGRVVALNSVIFRFLLWLKRHTRSTHIFVNAHNGPWDRHTFARHLRRTAERIGMDEGVIEKVTAYCLRHTYACAALTAGFTSKEVADQLGHSDTKMVEKVYGSHTAQDVKYLTRLADDIRSRRRA